MAQTDRDSPPLTITARLVECTPRYTGGFRCAFSVIKTSRRLKLEDTLEEKFFMRGATGHWRGSVTDASDGMLVLSTRNRVPPGEHELHRNANHNNQAVLEAAERLAESSREIHQSLWEKRKKKGTGGERKNHPISEEATDDSSEIISTDHPDQISLISRLLSDTNSLDHSLNNSQRLAVALALRSAPYKILGPPGTGKTKTVVEIMSQLLARKSRILVCAPSNVALDNIILRFLSSPYYRAHQPSFYRLGSSTKGLTEYNLEQLADDSIAFTRKEARELASPSTPQQTAAARELRQDTATRRRKFIGHKQKTSPVVFATLFSCLKEAPRFDFCIVDEACMATELESLLAVSKAALYILVGDPHQLTPSWPSLYCSLSLPTVLLSEQYRMPADLIAFSNSHFYSSLISSPRTDTLLFFGHSRTLFIDTASSFLSEQSSGTSRVNPGEALLVRDVLAWLRRSPELAGSTGTIGVITPYAAQVEYIRELLDGVLGELSVVDTVDGFQGQERDFILLSLVRSNAAQECGFVVDERRMNVAMTRCRRGLVIIGDSENFRRDGFLRRLMRFLEEHAYVTDPETYRMLVNESHAGLEGEGR